MMVESHFASGRPCLARFQFRLQKVLEMREQKEKLLQKRFMELLAAAEFEKNELRKLLERQEWYRNELIAKQRGTLEVGEVMNYLAYLESLAQWIDEQRIRVREAEERAEEARLDLLRASQEKKAVEKLKEKQYEDWVKEQQRAEIIFLDEISSVRYNKAQADGGKSRPGARKT